MLAFAQHLACSANGSARAWSGSNAAACSSSMNSAQPNAALPGWQKVQKNHLAWFIIEQLPVIPPAAYDRKFGPMTARDIARREVLHLTYTAHDMAPFARDMGYEGEPFRWDEADRRQRRARLDAIYFHLYGLSKDDAAYILSTFPIVAAHDQRDHARFLTRDLILAQMDALTAGDPDAVVVPR